MTWTESRNFEWPTFNLISIQHEGGRGIWDTGPGRDRGCWRGLCHRKDGHILLWLRGEQGRGWLSRFCTGDGGVQRRNYSCKVKISLIILCAVTNSCQLTCRGIARGFFSLYTCRHVCVMNLVLYTGGDIGVGDIGLFRTQQRLRRWKVEGLYFAWKMKTVKVKWNSEIKTRIMRFCPFLGQDLPAVKTKNRILPSSNILISNTYKW